MSWSRIHSIILRQYYLLRSSPTRVIPLFVWVMIDIVLWGFISRYMNQVAPGGPNFVITMLGAVLLWDFFIRVMQGVTMAFFEDIWARNLLNIFATPLRIPEYLTGLVLCGIGTSIIGLVVMLVLASFVFGWSIFAYGLLLIPFLLILFLFGIALGIFGSAVVLRLGPSSEWFVWPIPALLSPFAGVFYPVATLPHWMQYVSALLPPSYVFESLRAITAGGSANLPHLALGSVICLGYILLASWFFIRIHRRAVRTGLLARYSAESLS